MCSGLIISWLIGICLSVEVHQSPRAILRRPGDTVQLICSHEKTDFYVMYWFQKPSGATALKRIGHVYYSSIEQEESFKEHFSIKGDMSASTAKNGSLFVANLKAPDHDAVYYCAASGQYNANEAYFGPGTKLTVLEPDISVTAPTVTLLRPSPKECRNEKDQKRRKKTLVCLATGFYPDHIDVSWLVNDESVTDGVATDSAAQRPEGKKFYKISSRLRVAAEVWFNPDSVFTCQVSFFNGSGTENFTESIQGEAIVSQDVMTRDSYLKISQAAKLSYSIVVFKSCIYGAFVVFLVWKLQGRTGKQNF